MATIKQPVVDLAEKIKGNITIAKDGAITVDADTYVKHLPEDLTLEQATAASTYTANFLAAATKAVGEKSIPVMEKNKDVQQTEAVFPTIGKDFAKVTFDRVRESDNRNPTNGETIHTVKYGVANTSYTVQGARNVSSMKAVREELQEQAKAALAKAMK